MIRYDSTNGNVQWLTSSGSYNPNLPTDLIVSSQNGDIVFPSSKFDNDPSESLTLVFPDNSTRTVNYSLPVPDTGTFQITSLKRDLKSANIILSIDSKTQWDVESFALDALGNLATISSSNSSTSQYFRNGLPGIIETKSQAQFFWYDLADPSTSWVPLQTLGSRFRCSYQLQNSSILLYRQFRTETILSSTHKNTSSLINFVCFDGTCFVSTDYNQVYRDQIDETAVNFLLTANRPQMPCDKVPPGLSFSSGEKITSTYVSGPRFGFRTPLLIPDDIDRTRMVLSMVIRSSSFFCIIFQTESTELGVVFQSLTSIAIRRDGMVKDVVQLKKAVETVRVVYNRNTFLVITDTETIWAGSIDDASSSVQNIFFTTFDGNADVDTISLNTFEDPSSETITKDQGTLNNLGS